MSGAAREPSALGRYAPDPEAARMVQVVLLRLPLHLLRAGREHHDGLLREFRLLALAGEVPDSAAPLRLAELVTILGRQYASSRDRRDEEVDTAAARGEDCIDQGFELPETAAAAVRKLQALLDEADDYCRQAMLLTLPRPALLRRFSDWYLGELVGQVEGKAPEPWDGPLHL